MLELPQSTPQRRSDPAGPRSGECGQQEARRNWIDQGNAIVLQLPQPRRQDRQGHDDDRPRHLRQPSLRDQGAAMYKIDMVSLMGLINSW
jgi:hypothetical protein